MEFFLSPDTDSFYLIITCMISKGRLIGWESLGVEFKTEGLSV